MYVKFEFEGIKCKMITCTSFSGSECLMNNIPIIVGDYMYTVLSTLPIEFIVVTTNTDDVLGKILNKSGTIVKIDSINKLYIKGKI